MPHQFSFPTHVMYGPGARAELPNLLAEWRVTKPLLVTDPGIVKVGLHREIVDILTRSGVEATLFDGVEPNPVEANVNAGAEAYAAHRCDALIGLGGGSAIDVAKAVGLRATHDLPLAEYDEYRDGWKKTHPVIPPIVGIPTTAGTGSEVGRAAVITLDANRRKTVLFSPYLMPKAALLDPELTVGLPPHLTAATGMDALPHSMEAYLSTNFHPFCDAIALSGIRLCFDHLRRAIDDGSDLNARGMMLLASSMGATAFQKGLGVTHSLAHPLSTQHGIHHGLANAVLLPYTLRWNRSAARDKLAEIARAIGLPTEALSSDEAAESVVRATETLCRDVGIPPRLSALGIVADHIPRLAHGALEDGCRLTNPRPTGLDELAALYRDAL